MLIVGATRLSDQVNDLSSSSENDANNWEEDLYRRMAGGRKQDSSEGSPIESFVSLDIGFSEDLWTVLLCRRTRTPILYTRLVGEDLSYMVFVNCLPLSHLAETGGHGE